MAHAMCDARIPGHAGSERVTRPVCDAAPNEETQHRITREPGGEQRLSGPGEARLDRALERRGRDLTMFDQLH